MPSPTSPPMEEVESSDITIPQYILDHTVKIYQTGYRAGWMKAVSAYKDRKKADTHLINDPDPDPKKKGRKIAVFEAAPTPDEIDVSEVYRGNGLGEEIYTQGYVNGWEDGWGAYARGRTRGS